MLWFVFHVVSWFNPKVKRGIDGRKKLFENLELQLSLFLKERKRILIHSSSLGEFEQAKPIIAELKKKFPNVIIVASFFSPSGFENAKLDGVVDVKTYLPFDSVFKAKKFIEIVQPQLVMFMSYDLWSNHIWQMRKRNIPIVVANVRLRMNSFFKRIYYRMMLNEVQYIFAVSEIESEKIRSLNISKPHIETIGETRFDQVWKRAEESKQKQLLSTNILEGKKVFIIGSSWEEDERVLIPAVTRLSSQEENLLTIFVPHEPSETTLQCIESQLQHSTIRFSQVEQYNNEKIIMVDSVGVLFSLYQYAHVAFVGGSFKQNVHNVLEPAMFGIPILIGPYFENSPEAIELKTLQGIFSVSNETEMFDELTKFFTDEKLRRQHGNIAKQFVENHCGATEKVVKFIATILNTKSKI